MDKNGKVDCFGLTDRGKVRERNEDQYLVGGLNKSMLVNRTSLSIDNLTRLVGGTHGHILVVADGMGGHRSGDVASTAAIDSLTHHVLNTMPWFFKLEEDYTEDQLDALKDALRACQDKLQTLMGERSDKDGMGTTLTMAYVLWPRIYVVHAGDSRCYLLRGSKLEQVTTDHTFAQTLVEKGQLSAEEAEGSRWSHVLWNALGGSSDEVLPDAYKATLEVGDSLLLCTDGLTRHVDDESIVRILEENADAESACKTLVAEANEAGGEDNITVVLARFSGAEA